MSNSRVIFPNLPRFVSIMDRPLGSAVMSMTPILPGYTKPPSVLGATVTSAPLSVCTNDACVFIFCCVSRENFDDEFPRG